MNKILSQAIKKAVSEYNPNNVEVIKEKRPDLFSLSDQTELFQNSKGITIKIDRTRDSNLTDFGRATLSDRYLGANESYQESLFQSSNGFKNVQLGVTSPDFVPQLVAEQPSSTVFGTSTADSMTSTAIDTQTLSSYFDAVRGQTAQTVTDSLQF